MAFKSLGGTTGYLTLSSTTPVRVTANQTTPSARYVCHTLFIQQVVSNTGKIYLLDRSNGSGTTGVGVLATIPAPTLSGGIGVLLPWVAVTIPYAPGGINAADYYLGADNTSDKASVSAIVA